MKYFVCIFFVQTFFALNVSSASGKNTISVELYNIFPYAFNKDEKMVGTDVELLKLASTTLNKKLDMKLLEITSDTIRFHHRK